MFKSIDRQRSLKIDYSTFADLLAGFSVDLSPEDLTLLKNECCTNDNMIEYKKALKLISIDLQTGKWTVSLASK